MNIASVIEAMATGFLCTHVDRNGTICKQVTEYGIPSSSRFFYEALSRRFGAGPDDIVSSPVQVTVATPTELWLNVSRNQTSTEHFVVGFLKSASSYLNNKTIRISIDSLNYTLVTNSNGRFSLTLNLQPKNNTSTTYQVSASFEGDEPRNATAYAYTPHGTRYLVCTTVQFGLKPSVNTASFTVEPVATEVAATANATDKEENVEIPPPKTQEEMQQEAENGGWLSIWHEFSWWYPWYRLHLKININPMIDVGFNPLLPGGETYFWEGLEAFIAIVAEVVQEFIIDVIGVFVAYLAAKVLSVWNPAVGVIAEIVKGGIQFGLLVATNWFDKMSLLVSGIVNIVMGFIALEASIGKAFIQALCKLTSGSASSALLDLHFKLLHVLFVAQFTGRWWLDLLEASIDWIIGGIALVRYFTMS